MKKKLSTKSNKTGGGRVADHGSTQGLGGTIRGSQGMTFGITQFRERLGLFSLR